MKSNTLAAKRNFSSRVGGWFVRVGKFMGKKSTIVEVISSLLVILFIYTGMHKLLDYEEFKFQLGRSPYIQSISGPISILVPSSELIISLLLIIKKTRLLGLYASFFLMALFTGYIWIMLTYSYYLPCSCGGILNALSWKDHLIFNAIYTILTAIAIIIQNKLVFSQRK